MTTLAPGCAATSRRAVSGPPSVRHRDVEEHERGQFGGVAHESLRAGVRRHDPVDARHRGDVAAQVLAKAPMVVTDEHSRHQRSARSIVRTVPQGTSPFRAIGNVIGRWVARSLSPNLAPFPYSEWRNSGDKPGGYTDSKASISGRLSHSSRTSSGRSPAIASTADRAACKLRALVAGSASASSAPDQRPRLPDQRGGPELLGKRGGPTQAW